MPLGRSAALVLSIIINSTHCSCTSACQIQLEIWQEPDLAGFPKNGRIADLPERKSGATLKISSVQYQGSQQQEEKFQDPIFRKFQDNFRTFLSISRGSRHRKCTFFCAHKSLNQISIAVLKMLLRQMLHIKQYNVTRENIT